jgi:hypothetical protein
LAGADSPDERSCNPECGGESEEYAFDKNQALKRRNSRPAPLRGLPAMPSGIIAQAYHIRIELEIVESPVATIILPFQPKVRKDAPRGGDRGRQ